MWCNKLKSHLDQFKKMNKMFTFANCLMLIFLFGEASSNSQYQNPPQFWYQLMKGNGIWNEQIAVEMDKSYPFIEKLSKEENYKKPLPPSPENPAFENHNSTPNQLKHPGKQSLFFNLLELDNFYELVKGQEKVAKMVQNLAKTIINIKSLLIKKGQIAITMGQTENAVKFLAKQNGIAYEKAEQLELLEIVKSMATIWSKMSRINNGENAKEIVQKIVNLWQSAKQNDKFNEYFGNKSEDKNRRRKRLVRFYFDNGKDMSLFEVIFLGISLLIIIITLILCCLLTRR